MRRAYSCTSFVLLEFWAERVKHLVALSQSVSVSRFFFLSLNTKNSKRAAALSFLLCLRAW